ncbi:MAG: TIGR00730 family Rossman fold protein [Rhodothermaceae bacterium]
MKKICVFCGSSKGAVPEYMEAAELLGKTIAENKLELVYGGAKVGLMGKTASTVLLHNGNVTGVIPKDLFEKEVANTDLENLHVVNSMHERKAMMAEMADAFIALPGGFGTFEELFEILTWAQLEFHKKPIGILNINGYYDKLIEFIDGAIEQKFIKEEHRKLFFVDDSPAALIEKFKSYSAPSINKAEWLLGIN